MDIIYRFYTKFLYIKSVHLILHDLGRMHMIRQNGKKINETNTPNWQPKDTSVDDTTMTTDRQRLDLCFFIVVHRVPYKCK